MIERGRHLNIPRTEGYCLLCKSNQIEDEKHFLMYSKSFLIFKQFDMKEEVNLRIEYNLLLNKKLILLLAFL
jgi:hypothetical protein